MGATPGTIPRDFPPLSAQNGGRMTDEEFRRVMDGWRNAVENTPSPSREEQLRYACTHGPDEDEPNFVIEEVAEVSEETYRKLLDMKPAKGVYFTHIQTGPRPDWIRRLNALREGVPPERRTLVKWEDLEKDGY
jgi:hypothetical protein